MVFMMRRKAFRIPPSYRILDAIMPDNSPRNLVGEVFRFGDSRVSSGPNDVWIVETARIM
jgi:hypothetical protein